MRIAGLMILFVGACGGSGSGSPGGDTGGNVVTINWTLGAESNPVTTTIAAGTPVRWRSGDGVAHTVNPDANPPPSAVGLSGGGVTATQTITTPGSYSYHCSIHPGMHGTLVVQ
jgi:plastocyanin